MIIYKNKFGGWIGLKFDGAGCHLCVKQVDPHIDYIKYAEITVPWVKLLGLVGGITVIGQRITPEVRAIAEKEMKL